jgi:hypothetical protein
MLRARSGRPGGAAPGAHNVSLRSQQLSSELRATTAISIEDYAPGENPHN